MTQNRRLSLCLELIVCSFCPLLTDSRVEWPILGDGALLGLKANIPLNVLLTIPMFFRLYLVCRLIVLRSMMIQVE
jgi:hypothetical protein